MTFLDIQGKDSCKFWRECSTRKVKHLYPKENIFQLSIFLEGNYYVSFEEREYRSLDRQLRDQDTTPETLVFKN